VCRVTFVAWIIIKQSSGHKVDLFVLVRIWHGATTLFAKGVAPLAGRTAPFHDFFFALKPSKAVKCCVANGVSVGSGGFAAFRTMTLSDRADLSRYLESDASAQA
jgi:hypothetical protein